MSPRQDSNEARLVHQKSQEENKMRLQDLHELPKIKDSLTYLYVEHCRIEQAHKAIAIFETEGKTMVPCAALSALMLGPGTSISHAAILTLADNGCLVLWCGEEGVRFYAQGMGETRSAANLLRQATLCSNPAMRLQVVRQMYMARFSPGAVDPSLTLQQLRGREGIRVRETYVAASRATGVPWHGRSYDRSQWAKADPVNRALSVANSCLYGICHAAIVSAGYSPALGFIHTGKQLSFVYDIADLYKAQVTIPLAFQAAAAGDKDLERRVRLACRDAFKQERILARIVTDIDHVLSLPENLASLPIDTCAEEQPGNNPPDFDADPAHPGPLWDPDHGQVDGGQNFGGEEEPTMGKSELSPESIVPADEIPKDSTVISPERPPCDKLGKVLGMVEGNKNDPETPLPEARPTPESPPPDKDSSSQGE